MNDNTTNVIDLMALEKSVSAVVVPDGMRDTVIMGFDEHGEFVFLADSDELGQLALLITLAQRRIAALHDKILEPDDEPPPCAA